MSPPERTGEIPFSKRGSMAFDVLVLVLGFGAGFLSGLLGIGGGIVMAPALLYLPPLLGVGELDMRHVTGLTITQGLFACLSGAVRHDRYRCVNHRLTAWMGGSILASALAGSVLSQWVANETLMAIFAGLAVTAAVMMFLPKKEDLETNDANVCAFNIPLAVGIALVVGMLCGMVGQGGSFILIPLMLYVLKLPTRVVIGSNLALVFFSSLAGFAGKLATGQVMLLPAAFLVAGAISGAQLGSILSRRTRACRLRRVLAIVIALAAFKIGADVLGRL